MSSLPLLSFSHLLCFSLPTILSLLSCFFLHSFWPPSSPSHPRLNAYLCTTLVFHCVSVSLCMLLPEHFLCLHQYWSVFHAAPATLLASLGSMENTSTSYFISLLCFQKPVIRMILTVRITSLPHLTCPFFLHRLHLDCEMFPPCLIVPSRWQYTELVLKFFLT